jgi:hypothetical protein
VITKENFKKYFNKSHGNLKEYKGEKMHRKDE